MSYKWWVGEIAQRFQGCHWKLPRVALLFELDPDVVTAAEKIYSTPTSFRFVTLADIHAALFTAHGPPVGHTDVPYNLDCELVITLGQPLWVISSEGSRGETSNQSTNQGATMPHLAAYLLGPSCLPSCR